MRIPTESTNQFADCVEKKFGTKKQNQSKKGSPMFTLKDLCIALLSFAVVVILRSLRKASSEVHVNLPIMLGWFEGFVSLDEAIVRMTNALYAAKTQGLTLKRTLQSNTTVSVSITDANKTGTATLMFAARNKAASKLAQHLNELLQREDLKEFTK